MAHNLMVCLVFFFVIFHMTINRFLEGVWPVVEMDNPPINPERSGDDMVYEAYRYELTIEKTLDIKSKLLCFFFEKWSWIFFLNQMISPWFLVIRYQKDWLNTNPSEVGVLLGALLFWTSEVVAFRIGKPKKRQHTTIFFYFPRFGEIFWLTVNMAWSCWKGLWICIKWDILMATFHFGTQDVSYDGPWCTRPIAYSLYRSMVGSICVQVSARCALIWLSSTASGWGT